MRNTSSIRVMLLSGLSFYWGACLGVPFTSFPSHHGLTFSNQKMYLKFIIILLIARSTCFTLNLTNDQSSLYSTARHYGHHSIHHYQDCLGCYIHMGHLRSIDRFVPLNATTLMLVNAITGIIVWEDWRILENSVGYVCVFLLLALASYLLLSTTPLMTSENPQYGLRAHFR